MDVIMKYAALTICTQDGVDTHWKVGTCFRNIFTTN